MRGAEGIGVHGGTWQEFLGSAAEVEQRIEEYYTAATLTRWSPQGYPVVPHLAKEWEVSSDYRTFTFHLRRGVRWSDGHPFTTADVMYWWEYEAEEPLLNSTIPPVLRHRGGGGRVERIDDYSFRILFDEPYGSFLEATAMRGSLEIIGSPAHYLRPFHPRHGDPAKIAEAMRVLKAPSPRAAYQRLKNFDNPDCPRLWPWLYRTYKSNPPWGFVRNPYYFAVDEAGNQLPYIDQLLWNTKAPELIALAAASGETDCQMRHLGFANYTLLMSERGRSGYDLRHWYPGNRSELVIMPNLNRRVAPGDLAAAGKLDLMLRPEFRQALSVAINRHDIIRSYYSGVGEPAQVSPGPSSPFHDPELHRAFTEYDPARANRLLDALGLAVRDREGMRVLPGGQRLHFFIHTRSEVTPQVLQLVVEDWAAVGIRATIRIRARTLFELEMANGVHDFAANVSSGDFHPLVQGRMFAAVSSNSYFAKGFANWYERGGLYGPLRGSGQGVALAPDPGGPIHRGMELYDAAKAAGSLEERVRIFREITRLAAENTWNISIVTPPPHLVAVRDGFRNVPDVALVNTPFLFPANTGPETFYFAHGASHTPATAEHLRREILSAVREPGEELTAGQADRQGMVTSLLVALMATCAIAGVLLLGARHPFIGRRLAIMVPTLAVISILSFIIIQLPPGDYLTTKMTMLQDQGSELSVQDIADLREMFHFDDHPIKQYLRWAGFYWFTTFASEDRGLLQGHLGRSMETGVLVNDLVGDRILLTLGITVATVLFTWVIALPIGVYSAVRQYSWGDYLATVLGYLGLCVPAFLLAVVMLYVSSKYFGMSVSGLFSPAYAAQAEWSWGKFVDLVKHTWVPILILGVGGTASMIRVMRANLLDELRKPYVTVARAKGVRPLRLLVKYPVRLALNPFVSSIGGLFPELVSGGTIVAVVLSLPLVGPLMLSSLTNEDMYLAGSMLMILSLLGVLGTLVSDLLLLALDPRIRMEGGAS